MTAELEIVDEFGERTVVRVGPSPCDLSEHAIRIHRVAGGVRVESLTGELLRIDGEDLAFVSLAEGESADVARLRLRCRKGVARRTPVGVGGFARGVGRARRKPQANWIPAAAVTLALLLVAVFLIQRLSTSTWPHSPKHFVELAQIQYDNNKPERALETLAFAMADATGEVREQAVALDKKIRRMMLVNAASLQVSNARHQSEVIDSFVATYLQEPGRSAARECVRLCDQWLAQHGEVCGWHPDGQPLLALVTGIRGRHLSRADLQSPETAADVIFAARSRMRFQTRDYKEAWRRLDGFLAKHPGHAEVQAERERMLADGEEWLAKRLRRLDRSLANREYSRAEEDLAQLDQWAAIPEWTARLDERRQRLLAGREASAGR